MKSSALLALAIGVSSAAGSWFGRSDDGAVVRLPLRKSAIGPRPWQHDKFLQASQHGPPRLNVSEFWAGYTYTVDLSIGTPPQNTTVIFDTGSEELWVNPSCNNSLDDATVLACSRFGHYRPDRSSTSHDQHEEFGIIYGSGSAYGKYYTDNVHVGGIKLHQAQFGANNDSIGMVAGILGSGYGKGHRLKYRNIIDEMKNQGVIKKRQFSVVINHVGDATGEVIFGGIDTKKYSGKLSKAKILGKLQGDEQRYLINMTSIGISVEENSTHHQHHSLHNNHTVQGCKSTIFTKKHFHLPALLDTGTSIVFIPPEYVKAAAKAFPGAKYNKTQDLYFVDCDLQTRNTVDFGFMAPDGDEFTIKVPVERMVYKIPPSSDDAGRCIIGVLGASDFLAPFSVLGDTFLSSVLSVFDQDDDAIYLAPLKNCGSEIVPLSKNKDVASIEGKCPSRGEHKGCSVTTTSLAPKPTEVEISSFSIQPLPTTTWYAPSCTLDSCVNALDADPSAFDFCSDFLPLFFPSAATIAIPTQYRSGCAYGTQGVVSAVSSACICKLNNDARAAPKSSCVADSCLLYFYDPTYPDGMPYESTWCESFLKTSTSRSSYLPYGYWCATNKHSMRSVSSACSCFLSNPSIPTAVTAATTTEAWSTIWSDPSFTPTVTPSVPTVSPPTPTPTGAPWSRNVTSTSSFSYTSGPETSSSENVTSSAAETSRNVTSSATETNVTATSSAVETAGNSTTSAVETGSNITSSALETGTGSSSPRSTSTDLGWNATTTSAATESDEPTATSTAPESEESTTTSAASESDTLRKTIIVTSGSVTETDSLPLNFTATVLPTNVSTSAEASATNNFSNPPSNATGESTETAVPSETGAPTESGGLTDTAKPTGSAEPTETGEFTDTAEPTATAVSNSSLTVITHTPHPHHGHTPTEGQTVTAHVTTRFPKGGDCMGGCNCRQRTICHGTQYTTVFTADPTPVAVADQVKKGKLCTVVHICVPKTLPSDGVFGTITASGSEEPEPTTASWSSASFDPSTLSTVLARARG